jgi:hypothetical protein
MADSASLLPDLALALVSLPRRQPACASKAVGRPASGCARSCRICSLCRTLNGLDRAAATPADISAAGPGDLEDVPDRRLFAGIA